MTFTNLYWNNIEYFFIIIKYHVNRCSSSSLRGNVIASDAGRDNRKSAAAGAKDGQFSGGFVTRESLHGGQWPHPSSLSRASSPPIYLLPCLPHETLVPSSCRAPSTANASHGSPRDSRLCMNLIRQSDQLSLKSDRNQLGRFFRFLFLFLFLSRSHILRARPRRGNVSRSERSVKGLVYRLDARPPNSNFAHQRKCWRN